MLLAWTDAANALLLLALTALAVLLSKLASAKYRPLRATVVQPVPGTASIKEQLAFVRAQNMDGITGAAVGHYYLLSLVLFLVVLYCMRHNWLWLIPFLPFTGLLVRPRAFSLATLGIVVYSQWAILSLFTEWQLFADNAWLFLPTFFIIIVWTMLVDKYTPP